jgi:phage baseplate assembly protein W
LNRAFGVWTRYIDKPQNIALPLVRWLFTVAIQAWEPRFQTSKVDFSATSEADALGGIVQAALTGSIDVGAINPYRGLLLSAQQAPSTVIVTPAGQLINVPSS